MARIAFFLFVFVLFLGFGLLRLNAFNHFDKIEDQFAGSCAPVTGVAGPEDLQIDPALRRAFVSSLDRRAVSRGEDVRGAILSVNIDDPLDMSGWRDRTNGVPEAFEPVGLHYYIGEGVRRLFVVNDAAKTIELYDVIGVGDLVHLETFAERRLTSPNDVVAVGPRSFYVTNDLEPGRSSFLGRLHFLGQVGSGQVLYFNGTAWRVAAEGLRFANGVNVSIDGSRLYVAETAGGALKIYNRDRRNGALTLDKTAPLAIAPDNINIDASGTLWIGGMQKPLAFLAHSRDPKNTAPSAIVRLKDQPGLSVEPDYVFSDRGERISAASAAASLDSKLVVGAVLEERYLLCDMASQ